MSSKITTRGGYDAPALFTIGGSIPTGAANYRPDPTITRVFQVVNYGEEAVEMEVRLAGHTDQESVTIVCYPGQPTFELMREIVLVPANAVLNWVA